MHDITKEHSVQDKFVHVQAIKNAYHH